MPAYDTNSIFAKILRREIPCITVFEDDDVLAFMDVMPQSNGHTLVVPKLPIRGLLDCPPPLLATLIQRTQTIAQAVKTGMAADGLSIMQFNETAGGQTVFHLHFHVIPRWNDRPLRQHSGGMADRAVLENYAALIRDALG